VRITEKEVFMKKLLTLVLAVTTLALIGCGGGADKSSGGSDAKAEKVVKVGASPVPHAEILEVIKPELEKEGVKLEIVEFNDYVQPNLATNDKEIDPADVRMHILKIRQKTTPEFIKSSRGLGYKIDVSKS